VKLGSLPLIHDIAAKIINTTAAPHDGAAFCNLAGRARNFLENYVSACTQRLRRSAAPADADLGISFRQDKAYETWSDVPRQPSYDSPPTDAGGKVTTS
jgi:hypothetical protein